MQSLRGAESVSCDYIAFDSDYFFLGSSSGGARHCFLRKAW